MSAGRDLGSVVAQHLPTELEQDRHTRLGNRVDAISTPLLPLDKTAVEQAGKVVRRRRLAQLRERRKLADGAGSSQSASKITSRADQ